MPSLSNRKVISLIAFLILLFSVFTAIYSIQDSLETICSHILLLGWDPSARFNISLELADSLRKGNIWSALILFLDSPTWPSLRNIFESILILIYGAKSWISITITQITFYFLILLSHTFLYRNIRNIFLFILGTLAFDWMLLHTEPLLQYAQSGMLEIQGALFYLLCLEAWFLVQKNKEWKLQNLRLLALVTILLLLTKYPYVLQFLFALLFLFFLQNYYSCIELGKNYLRWFFLKGNRRILLPFLILSLSLIFLGKFQLLNLTSKVSVRLIQIFVVLFMLDIHYFLNSPNLQKSSFQKNLKSLWLLIYLPSLVWIIIHPDRFASLFPTLRLEQGENRFLPYLDSFYRDLPIHYIVWIACGYTLIHFIGITLFQKFHPSSKRTASKLRQAPMYLSRFHVYASLSILLMTGQLLTTSNQQARHIYHLYPAFLLSILFLLYHWAIFLKRFLSLFIRKRISNFQERNVSFYLQFIYYFLVVSTSIWLILIMFLKRNDPSPSLCYVENKYDVAAIPDWITEIRSDFIEDKSIVINDLPLNHINRPDSELLIREFAYDRKYSIVVNPKSIQDGNWNHLIRVSPECAQNLTQSWAESRFEKEIKLNLLKQEVFPSKQDGLSACMEKYTWKQR